MNYFIYIMTNQSNKVLYTGVTNNLERRVWEHKTRKDPKSFTTRYNVDKLVYYECFSSSIKAIEREKQIKGGSRKKKIDLIKRLNPDWDDLSTLK